MLLDILMDGCHFTWAKSVGTLGAKEGRLDRIMVTQS